MASPEISNQSSLFLSEISKFPSHIVALYNSDDFQTRVCWWLIYILAILMVLIHLGWKLYGPEISKTFKLQGMVLLLCISSKVSFKSATLSPVFSEIISFLALTRWMVSVWQQSKKVQVKKKRRDSIVQAQS